MEAGLDEVRVTLLEKNNEQKMKKSYFDVLGVCCSSEVVLIEKVLQNLDGVQSVRVIVPTRTLIVVHDELQITQSQIGQLCFIDCFLLSFLHKNLPLSPWLPFQCLCLQ